MRAYIANSASWAVTAVDHQATLLHQQQHRIEQQKRVMAPLLLSSIDPQSFPEAPPSMAVEPLDTLTEHVGEPLEHLRNTQ